jgi:hypothetical protein
MQAVLDLVSAADLTRIFAAGARAALAATEDNHRRYDAAAGALPLRDPTHEERLAAIEAATVDAAWRACGTDDLPPPLAWAVGEVLDWITAVRRCELTGDSSPWNSITWVPETRHDIAGALPTIVAERLDLLARELVDFGLAVVPAECIGRRP